MLGFTWDEWNLQDQHQKEQKATIGLDQILSMESTIGI
jgi:hypothetical protein